MEELEPLFKKAGVLKAAGIGPWGKDGLGEYALGPLLDAKGFCQHLPGLRPRRIFDCHSKLYRSCSSGANSVVANVAVAVAFAVAGGAVAAAAVAGVVVEVVVVVVVVVDVVVVAGVVEVVGIVAVVVVVVGVVAVVIVGGVDALVVLCHYKCIMDTVLCQHLVPAVTW